MVFILLASSAVVSNSGLGDPDSPLNDLEANAVSLGDKTQFEGNEDSSGKSKFNDLSYLMNFGQGVASSVKITGVNAYDVVTQNKIGEIKDSKYYMDSGSLELTDAKYLFTEIDVADSYYDGKVSVDGNLTPQDIKIKFKSGNFRGTSDKLSLWKFFNTFLNINYCEYKQDPLIVNNTYKYKITKATGTVSADDEPYPYLTYANGDSELLGENVTFNIGNKTYANASLKIKFKEIEVKFRPQLTFTNASFDLIVVVDPASPEIFQSVTITTPSTFSATDYIGFFQQKSASITAYDPSTAVKINIPLQKYPLTSRFGFWYQNVRYIKFTPENLANFDLQATNTLELAFDMSDVKKINPQANIFSIFLSKNASPLITFKFDLNKLVLTFPPGTMNTDTVINIVYNDKVTASYFKFNQAGNFYDATFASKIFVGGYYSTVINNPSSGSLYFKNSFATSRSNQSLLNIQNLVQSKKVKKQISESDFDFIKARTAFITDSEKFSNQISRRLINWRINNDFRTVLDEYEATVNITLDLLKNGSREFPTEVIANQINC